MDSTPLVAITGQVRTNLIGTDAFQETDVGPASRFPSSSTRGSCRTSRSFRASCKAAFHVAQTGRSGPVHVDIAKDVQEAEFDFRYPEDVDLPGWKPPRARAPRQIQAAQRPSRRRKSRSSTSAGARSTPSACGELLELAEAGGSRS
jgi:acetolactate synthase-1/2/3 large subunit